MRRFMDHLEKVSNDVGNGIRGGISGLHKKIRKSDITQSATERAGRAVNYIRNAIEVIREDVRDAANIARTYPNATALAIGALINVHDFQQGRLRDLSLSQLATALSIGQLGNSAVARLGIAVMSRLFRSNVSEQQTINLENQEVLANEQEIVIDLSNVSADEITMDLSEVAADEQEIFIDFPDVSIGSEEVSPESVFDSERTSLYFDFDAETSVYRSPMQVDEEAVEAKSDVAPATPTLR